MGAADGYNAKTIGPIERATGRGAPIFRAARVPQPGDSPRRETSVSRRPNGSIAPRSSDNRPCRLPALPRCSRSPGPSITPDAPSVVESIAVPAQPRTHVEPRPLRGRLCILLDKVLPVFSGWRGQKAESLRKGGRLLPAVGEAAPGRGSKMPRPAPPPAIGSASSASPAVANCLHSTWPSSWPN